MTDTPLRPDVTTAVGRHLRQTHQEIEVWTTWKLHSLRSSCGPLNQCSPPRSKGDEGEVGVEMFKRELN